MATGSDDTALVTIVVVLSVSDYLQTEGNNGYSPYFHLYRPLEDARALIKNQQAVVHQELAFSPNIRPIL